VLQKGIFGAREVEKEREWRIETKEVKVKGVPI
jgi:hypothetical protein